MKVQFVRATSDGETVSAECQLKDHSEWDAKVKPVLARLDERVLEMNMRYVTALKVVEKFPAEYQAAFKMAIDCLYGRQVENLQNLPFPRAEETKDEQPA